MSVLAYTNAGTMKLWKRSVNKRLRGQAKVLLSHWKRESSHWDDILIPEIDEIGTLWDSPKDGPSYRIYRKPDNDECIREWSKRGDRAWKRGHYPSFVWTEVEMPKLVDGHYQSPERSWRNYCQCICNKKSYYWIGLRK